MQKFTVGQLFKRFRGASLALKRNNLDCFQPEFQRSSKIGLNWLKAFHFSKLQSFIREGLYN